MIADAVLAPRIFVDVVLGSPPAEIAVRVAVSRSLAVDRAARVGAATIEWTQASLAACVLRVDLARPLHLRPCAAFSAGWLDAAGANVTTPTSRTRPWLSAEATARLVWAPVRALVVELEAGALAPILRESFFFEPGVPVYEAPSVAFVGRAGAGVRFP